MTSGSDTADVSLEMVASFSTLAEAHLAKSYLEQHGILCFLYDQYMGGLDPGYLRAVGGAKLVTSSKQATEAKNLLAEIERRQLSVVPEAEDAPELTPGQNDGGIEIQFVLSRWHYWLILILILLFVL